MDASFGPEHRFHDRRDYGRVFYRQQKAAGKYLVVLVLPRPDWAPKRSRLGIMVSTKVHKRAVRRHAIKRWIREVFRCELQQAHPGHDVVVVVRRDPPAEGYQSLRDELHRLLPKALAAQAKPGSGQGRRRGRKR